MLAGAPYPVSRTAGNHQKRKNDDYCERIKVLFLHKKMDI
jgi:hypothetical protein